MIDHVLQFKREAEKINKRIVKFNLYFLPHNGSGFDSFIILNNFPQWKTVVSLIKSGSVIVVSLKRFNGFVDKNKKTPQYVLFRCARVHINIPLKRIGNSYKLQRRLLEQELKHDEIYEDTWEEKESE